MAPCLLVTPAVALTPLPPCERIESGMRVSGAEPFGYYGSGFATEEYSNALENDAGADGVYDFLAVSVPALAGFSGYRVIDCKSGEFLAIASYNGSDPKQLTATEFLRNHRDEGLRRCGCILVRRDGVRCLLEQGSELRCGFARKNGAGEIEVHGILHLLCAAHHEPRWRTCIRAPDGGASLVIETNVEKDSRAPAHALHLSVIRVRIGSIS